MLHRLSVGVPVAKSMPGQLCLQSESPLGDVSLAGLNPRYDFDMGLVAAADCHGSGFEPVLGL
ncbi:MAG TPA: hypothetical protein VEL68_18510, partial [Thermodesulfobacteriota bacterium]|nr:hypothetical protein [Thermodesulfobacteriota bacterium]